MVERPFPFVFGQMGCVRTVASNLWFSVYGYNNCCTNLPLCRPIPAAGVGGYHCTWRWKTLRIGREGKLVYQVYSMQQIFARVNNCSTYVALVFPFSSVCFTAFNLINRTAHYTRLGPHSQGIFATDYCLAGEPLQMLCIPFIDMPVPGVVH